MSHRAANMESVQVASPTAASARDSAIDNIRSIPGA